MTDLARHFSEAARRHGNRIALITAREQVSFAELDRRAAAFATTCAARGIGKGDRVLVAMAVGIDLYVALAGLWRLGAVAVFPEPAMGLAGVRRAISVTAPRALVATGLYRLLRVLPGLWPHPCLGPSHADRGAADHAALSPGDPALISFTSGSTGAPKAIPRSHGYLMAQHDAVRALLSSEAEEVDLVAFPVFALVNLAEGRTTVLPNWPITRPDQVRSDKLAAWIGRAGATRALLPPSLCEILARQDIPNALHTVFTGGGPVKPALVDRLLARRPGLRIVSVYGSTEAEPIAELDWAEVTEADRAEMAAGGGLLTGSPVAGTEVRIEDDEIWVAGPHVNTRYLDPAMEAGTKVPEGGRIWHRTGDAGRLDPMGRLWLLGRLAGRADGPSGHLYPFSVELAAEGWPGVRRAALSGTSSGPILVIEGDADTDVLRDRARDLGVGQVRRVQTIPLDRRHRSKIDQAALSALIGRGQG